MCGNVSERCCGMLGGPGVSAGIKTGMHTTRASANDTKYIDSARTSLETSRAKALTLRRPAEV